MKKLALLLAILFVFQINFVKASDKKVIPPEYKLVEVVETNYNVDDVNTISKESRFWNSWEIRNLSEDNYDIYYPDDPVISDYYDGEYKGTEFVHKPIGLKFMQYKYRK